MLGRILIAGVFLTSALQAAPRRSEAQEITESIAYVRHEVHNHDLEIQSLQKKLEALEWSNETLQNALLSQEQAADKQIKGSLQSLQEQIASQSNGSGSDIKLLKEHANETTTALRRMQERLEGFEKGQRQLEENFKKLHKSVLVLMNALEIPDPYSESSYTVKSGDSLEKIARKHGTTILRLKEMNGLKGDRITIGQKLQISE